LVGNAAAVLAHAQILAALSKEHGIKSYEGITGFYKGWAMHQALSLSEAKKIANHIPYLMSLLAEVHARAGKIHSALALAAMRNRGSDRQKNTSG
jgi:hypothetical protein